MALWDILFRRNVKPSQIYVDDDAVNDPWLKDNEKYEVLEVENGWVKYVTLSLRDPKYYHSNTITNFLLTKTLYKGKD